MAQPVEIFGAVKGMTRDYAVDNLPDGYLWNLVDAIPQRKGSRVDMRGGWTYHGVTDYGAVIQGGYYSAFTKGQRLLLVANGQVWDVDLVNGAGSVVGPGPATMVQNGVKLNDRVFFMDGAGLIVPKSITFNGTTVAVGDIHASGPKAKVGLAYRQRLCLAGDPAAPEKVFFSHTEDSDAGPGPLAPWDTKSWIGTNQEVTGLAGMASQILVFHPAMIERIRGTTPPEEDVDTDMGVETLTDQVGCILPHTIVPWRENIIFADERGVFMTDGSTVRNLTELGGMGDFWRQAYGSRIAGRSVSCGTFLDYLVVTVLSQVGSFVVPFTMVCDLGTRAWFRFRNFPATCYIPSESGIEEAFCGNHVSHRLMKTSPMFQDPVAGVSPTPDYLDGDDSPVYSRMATGFKRLSREEGMKRIRSIRVSYHHESLTRAPASEGLRIEYRTDPPNPEEIDPTTGDATGWIEAGRLPDALEYTRKKVPVGKRGYGLMVRVTALSSARTSRFFSIGVETTDQDRGKVTT